MVMIYFPNMLTSVENLSPVNCTNANTILSSNTNSRDSTNTTINGSNAAKAVLICHPNSHIFLDRTLLLDKPIKIGRSVGHNKTSVNIGIFDCKVLSRNHALLWFEDGKFWLRDTRSSNGTFVNTERLSKSGEESAPREVFSGDTVQFGVDVVENSRNVTHGSVIATLILFLPNGREAKPVPLPFIPADRNKVTLEDLYHLNQYLQESLQREQMLEMKLNALQTLMNTLRDSTELSWKALNSNINLLSRVELLEVQLKCYSNKFADDTLREELRILQEDKNAYEIVVKQYFQKILDEKIEASQQCQDLNRALEDTKTKFTNTQMMLSNYQTELRELASKNSILEKNNEELEIKLQVIEKKGKETVQKLSDENILLYNQVKNLSKTEEVLQQTIKELEAHGDYAHRQVMSLQSQVEELQKHHGDILCELVDPSVIKDKINDMDLVKSWIYIYMEALKKCKDDTVIVRQRAEQLRNEKLVKCQEVTILECELNKCAITLKTYKEEQTEIESKIMERKSEIELFKPVPDILDELNGKKCNTNHILDLHESNKLLNVMQRHINMAKENMKELEKLSKLARAEQMEVTVSCAVEEDKLDLSEKHLSNLETAVKTLREHVENLDTYYKEKTCIEDVQCLKKQLSGAHELIQGKQNMTEKLVKHFSDFMSVIIQKVNAIQSSFLELENPSHNSFVHELKFLKEKSSRLVSAVNKFQSVMVEHSNSHVQNMNKQAEDIINYANKKLLPVEESGYMSFTEVALLKERLRHAAEEKKNLETEFMQLRQKYEFLRSYPYFDIYFIISVVILIFAFIFDIRDKLLTLFNTKE